MRNYLKAETEVKRLDQLKASKMKEFFFKKQIELEDICRKSHMEIPSRSEMEKIISQIDSGKTEFLERKFLVVAHTPISHLTHGHTYKRGD